MSPSVFPPQGDDMAGGYQIGLWCLLITATACDLFWGKVFNWVNGLFLLGGLFTHFILGGFPAIVAPFQAIVLAFAFFFPFYYVKAFAAGDVKLLMAIGAWTDPRLVFEMGIVAILVGAVVGTWVMLRTRGLKSGLDSMKKHLKQKEKPKAGTRMPFAPAFLCAFFLIQIWGARH